MGFETTVIVFNDALHEIELDPQFGAKLAKGIRALTVKDGPIRISSGSYSSAAHAIESHHADSVRVLAVSNYQAQDIGAYDQPPEQKANSIHIVRDLAWKLGFTLRARTSKSYNNRPGPVPRDQKQDAFTEIKDIIELADARASAVDGPVDHALKHLSEKDIERIYRLVKKSLRNKA